MFLAGGASGALTHPTAGGLVLLGCVGCRPGFPRRRECSAAGGGFGALARVDFGFKGCGFCFDDPESALNGIVRRTCGSLVRVIEESEM